MFVLDTSVAICWYLEDEFHPNAEIALVRIAEDGAVVPALFWFEFRNVLWMAERRKRLSNFQTTRSLNFIGKLAIQTHRQPDENLTMSLARRHKLSFYDASYLELAQRQVLPLATLDSELVRAARAEKVELVGAS